MPLAESLLPLVAVTAVAGCLHGLAGFGFALIATPLFMSALGSADGVVLVMIVNLCLSAGLALSARRDLDRELLLRCVIGLVPGIPVSTAVLMIASMEALLVGLGVMLVAFVAWSLAGRVGEGSPQTRYGNRSAVGVGFLGGVTGASLGMPGPPMVAFLSAIGVERDAFRATMLAFFAAAYVAALALQQVGPGIRAELWVTGLVLVPVALAAGVSGGLVARRVGEDAFRGGVLFLIGVVGIASLVRGLMGS